METSTEIADAYKTPSKLGRKIYMGAVTTTHCKTNRGNDRKDSSSFLPLSSPMIDDDVLATEVVAAASKIIVCNSDNN